MARRDAQLLKRSEGENPKQWRMRGSEPSTHFQCRRSRCDKGVSVKKHGDLFFSETSEEYCKDICKMKNLTDILFSSCFRCFNIAYYVESSCWQTKRYLASSFQNSNCVSMASKFLEALRLYSAPALDMISHGPHHPCRLLCQMPR